MAATAPNAQYLTPWLEANIPSYHKRCSHSLLALKMGTNNTEIPQHEGLLFV